MGLFGGSFDPIHLGHLILAEASLQELQLDRVIFIPAGISPFKAATPPVASVGLRIRMLRSAIGPEPRFALDEREILRKGPSYAIDTVRELVSEYPGTRFVYLIGADHLPDLSRWHEIGELRNLVDFAVLDRGSMPETDRCGFPVVRRRIDLSSTEIRTRLAQGLSIRFMVPETVYETIMTSRPYPRIPHGNS